MIKIRMLENARPELLFLAKPGTVLRRGKVYEAKSNPRGAVSGLCANWEYLGVRPGEFVFVEAPEWLITLWRKEYPQAVERIVEVSV